MSRMTAFDISAQGLSAQRQRLDIVAENIANVNTTRSSDGGPFKRKQIVFETLMQNQSLLGDSPGGVQISEIAPDNTPFKQVYEPGHPDANSDGYVQMPNINVVEEMVDMISATRSYEANVTVMNSSKSMLMKALEIGRR